MRREEPSFKSPAPQFLWSRKNLDLDFGEAGRFLWSRISLHTLKRAICKLQRALLTHETTKQHSKQPYERAHKIFVEQDFSFSVYVCVYVSSLKPYSYLEIHPY